MTREEMGLHLLKGNFGFTFEGFIPSGSGIILGAEMITMQPPESETAAVALAEGTCVSYK